MPQKKSDFSTDVTFDLVSIHKEAYKNIKSKWNIEVDYQLEGRLVSLIGLKVLFFGGDETTVQKWITEQEEAVKSYLLHRILKKEHSPICEGFLKDYNHYVDKLLKEQAGVTQQ